MKYCAKCGTPMSDDTVLCPQCYPETDDQQPQIFNKNSLSPQKNSNKNLAFVITNAILTTISLISLTITLLNPSSANNSTNYNNATSDNYNATCPASKYGNHDWAPARCTEPAQCYNCDAYKDNKLGEHSFYTHDDGLCDCSYCGILYDVYIASLDE